MNPSEEYKNAALYATIYLKPSGMASFSCTIPAQWQMIVSTKTLKVMGYNGYPWVTPQ